MNLGSDFGHEKRVAEAVTIKNSKPPDLYGLRKNHKGENNDGFIGHSVRPVCAANESNTSRLSHLLCMFLKPVTRAADRGTACEATEEMIIEAEEVNASLKREFEDEFGNEPEEKVEIVAGSLDVKKMYPSFKMKRTAEVIKNIILESGVKFENIDFILLSKYLANNLSKEQISAEGLDEILHTRSDCKKDKKWLEPKRYPLESEKQKMIAVGVTIGIKFIMGNHIHAFGDEVFKQLDGGPIGDKLTTAIADCFILDWDRRVLEKLRNLGIKVRGYKRFFDDTNIFANSVSRKYKYSDGQLVRKTEEEIDKDKEEETDKLTMEIIREIADSVEDMIDTEADYPSANDGKLPILDIKVWVKKEENQPDQIFYEFYEKEISSQFVIMKDSAAPLQQKRTVLTQEIKKLQKRT